jgi:hypothetical protein
MEAVRRAAQEVIDGDPRVVSQAEDCRIRSSKVGWVSERRSVPRSAPLLI